MSSVVFERVRLDGLGGVIKRVRVLRGLALKLARAPQAAGAAVAEEPVGRRRQAVIWQAQIRV